MKSAPFAVLLVVLSSLATAPPASAQDSPQRIGIFVVDLHGIIPRFGDAPELADSRGLSQAEMPGSGLGLSAGAHVYLPKVLGITVGLGVEGLIGHSHATPPAGATTTVPSSSTSSSTTSSTTSDTTSDTTVPLRAVSETFKAVSPELSLNFAGPTGWSYLSGGIGRSTLSIIPEGAAGRPLDTQVYNTINYGGGARWFIKPRLAFSLDVRFWQLANGTPVGDFPGSPRTVLLVIGAGISVR